MSTTNKDSHSDASVALVGIEVSFSNLLGTLSSVTTPALKPSTLAAKIGGLGELGMSTQLFTDFDASTNVAADYEEIESTGFSMSNDFLLMGGTKRIKKWGTSLLLSKRRM